MFVSHLRSSLIFAGKGVAFTSGVPKVGFQACPQRVEVTYSVKRSSLLRYGINSARKKFCRIDPLSSSRRERIALLGFSFNVEVNIRECSEILKMLNLNRECFQIVKMLNPNREFFEYWKCWIRIENIFKYWKCWIRIENVLKYSKCWIRVENVIK